MKKSRFLIIVALIFTILFYREYNQIINYPMLTIIFLSGLIVVLQNIIKTILKEKKLKWLKGLYFIPTFYISFLLIGNIFNLINYKYSKQNDMEYELCDITNVGCMRRHNGLYFIFKGKQKYFKYISSEVDEMCETKEFDNYKMEIKCKQGMLDSWIIYDFNILTFK